MKLIVLALVFQFVISCWPKTNIITLCVHECLMDINQIFSPYTVKKVEIWTPQLNIKSCNTSYKITQA